MSFNTSLNLSWIVQTSHGEVPISQIKASPTSFYIDVTIYPQWYKQISLEWKVPTEFGPCVFNVYFSSNGDSEWVKVNHAPINNSHFSDTNTSEYSIYHDGYYIVEAVLTSKGNTTIRSAPVTWKNKRRNWVELRATEIQRREYMLLSHFVGIKSFLFRKRIYGPRCPRCWSYEAEKVVDDNCPVCFGTGFDGGYSDPIPLYIQYEPSPHDKQKSYMGTFEPNQIGAWTISVPDIQDEDIIARVGDWAVYKVVKVIPTELQGVTVRQQMALGQLSRKDIENELLNRSVTGLGSSELLEFQTKFKDRFNKGLLETPVNSSPKFYKENPPPELPIKYTI